MNSVASAGGVADVDNTSAGSISRKRTNSSTSLPFFEQVVSSGRSVGLQTFGYAPSYDYSPLSLRRATRSRPGSSNTSTTNLDSLHVFASESAAQQRGEIIVLPDQSFTGFEASSSLVAPGARTTMITPLTIAQQKSESKARQAKQSAVETSTATATTTASTTTTSATTADTGTKPKRQRKRDDTSVATQLSTSAVVPSAAKAPSTTEAALAAVSAVNKSTVKTAKPQRAGRPYFTRNLSEGVSSLTAEDRDLQSVSELLAENDLLTQVIKEGQEMRNIDVLRLQKRLHENLLYLMTIAE